MKKQMLLLLFLLLAFLAACGEKNQIQVQKSQDESAVEPAGDSYSVLLSRAQPETISYPMEAGEPLTAVLPQSYSYETTDSEFYRTLVENTGAELKVTFLPTEEYWGNLMNLVAGDDIPDLIWGWDMNIDGEQDYLLELDDYLQTDCPNYLTWLKQDPDRMASVLPEKGEIFQFYSLMETPVDAMYMGPVVRQDLLDQYDLARPETYADWENVLLTLKDVVKQPLDLSYEAISGANWLCAGYDVSLAGGEERGFYQVDGVVKYGPLEPGFTECVTMLREWFDQGIFDNRFLDFPDINSSEYLLKMANGDSAIFFLSYDKLNSLTAVSEVEGFQAALLPDPVQEPGQQTHLCQTDGTHTYQATFCIAADCTQPERAVRFVDYLYSEEGIRLCCLGLEGQTYTIENGTPEFTEAALENPELLQKSTSLVLTGVLLEQRQKGLDPEFFEAQDVWMERKDAAYHLPMELYYGYYDDEDMREVVDRMTELATYTESQTLQFITGQRPLEQIPDMQEHLRELEAEECIAMIQQRMEDFYQR